MMPFILRAESSQVGEVKACQILTVERMLEWGLVRPSNFYLFDSAAKPSPNLDTERHGIRSIVSFDRDFGRWPRIQRIHRTSGERGWTDCCAYPREAVNRIPQGLATQNHGFKQPPPT